MYATDFTKRPHYNVHINTYRISQVWFMNAPHSITYSTNIVTHTYAPFVIAATDQQQQQQQPLYVITLFRKWCIHHDPTASKYVHREQNDHRFFNAIHTIRICSDSNSIQSNAHPSLLLFRKKKNLKIIHTHGSTPRGSLYVHIYQHRSSHQTAVAFIVRQKCWRVVWCLFPNGSFLFYTVARCTHRFFYFMFVAVRLDCVKVCTRIYFGCARFYFGLKKWQQPSNDVCLLWQRSHICD